MSSVRRTVGKARLEFLNAIRTMMYLQMVRPGTGSKVRLGRRCLISVWSRITVVRMRLDGLLEGILQRLKALSVAQCVSIGAQAAARGLRVSEFVTVALTTCMSCRNHPTAFYASVETADKVNSVIKHFILCSQMHNVFWRTGSQMHAIVFVTCTVGYRKRDKSARITN